MGTNTNPLLEDGFCTTGIKNDIPETLRLLGLTPENPILDGRVVNKIFNMIFENLNHQKKKGFAFWQPDSYYEATENNIDVCRRNNQIYFCIQTHNETGEEPKAPETNPDFWTILYDLDKPLFDEFNKYALKNGDILNIFKVKDAVEDNDAVNKKQVIELFSAYQPFPIGHTMMADIIYDFTLVEFGGLFNRLDYPKLWAFIESHPALLKTEAQWQTENTANGMCGFFSSGNGTTTFRVRNMEGAFQRSSNRGINTYEADIIKSHTHSTSIGSNGVPHFFQTYSGPGQFGPILSATFITGETGGVETRPKNIAKLPLIVYK